MLWKQLQVRQKEGEIGGGFWKNEVVKCFLLCVIVFSHILNILIFPDSSMVEQLAVSFKLQR